MRALTSAPRAPCRPKGLPSPPPNNSPKMSLMSAPPGWKPCSHMGRLHVGLWGSEGCMIASSDPASPFVGRWGPELALSCLQVHEGMDLTPLMPLHDCPACSCRRRLPSICAEPDAQLEADRDEAHACLLFAHPKARMHVAKAGPTCCEDQLKPWKPLELEPKPPPKGLPWGPPWPAPAMPSGPTCDSQISMV